MPAEATGSPSTVLVTGASSGIGEALAHCFARDGHRLVLVARRASRLRALAESLRNEHGTHVDVVPTDLARRGAAAALAALLRRRRRAIDVLVNNAGVLGLGAFVGSSAAQHLRLIDLNVSGLTDMLAAFVPAMVRRGHGRVLNVASIAAFVPVPGLAVYAASKAYVLSLTESLAEELRDTGVTVTVLCPGITATAMFDRAIRDNVRVAELPGFVVGDVREVAMAGYRACMAGATITVPGALNRAVSVAGRATPKWLLRRIAGAVGRRML
jgi:short-subunit dehydrogenase